MRLTKFVELANDGLDEGVLRNHVSAANRHFDGRLIHGAVMRPTYHCELGNQVRKRQLSNQQHSDTIGERASNESEARKRLNGTLRRLSGGAELTHCC